MTQRLEKLSTVDFAATAPRPKRRTEWVDVAKGVGITLVVAGHAVDGLMTAGLASPASGWALGHYVVYTFHMPLFFMLAGLFVQSRISEDSAGFGYALVSRMAWPYFLWSGLQLIVIFALGSAVNVPFSGNAFRFFALLWSPTSQFWFLHALFLMSLLALALGVAVDIRWWFPIAVVLRILSETAELPRVIDLLCRFAIWHALGVVYGGLMRERLQQVPLTYRVAALASGAFLLLIFGFPASSGSREYWDLSELPAALGGVTVVLMLSSLPRFDRYGVLAHLGARSMSIFLLHIFFTAGTRIVLVHWVGEAGIGMAALAATLAGLLGPLLVLRVSTKLGMNRLLGLGG